MHLRMDTRTQLLFSNCIIAGASLS